MDRKRFIQLTGLGISSVAYTSVFGSSLSATSKQLKISGDHELSADLVIAGGGLGGCAAALAALRNNISVILTEETDWIGGQLTQQGVPPDEHQWIETRGCTKLYRNVRNEIRQFYIRNYPLTMNVRLRANLNPGDGAVSKLCHEPRVALAVLEAMLLPYISSGQLTLLTQYKIVAADVTRDKVNSLKAVNTLTGATIILSARYFADATELGDVLPLTGTEFVTGTESVKDTGELHAPQKADPDNHQAFTVCFAMDYLKGENHTIDKPKDYHFWQNFVPKLMPPWPGKLLSLAYSQPSTLRPKQLGFHPEGISTGEALNLWNYRRIINRNNFTEGKYRSDITCVNWPQNDYLLGNLIGVSNEEFKRQVDNAKQLSLSLLYWLQTEAPHPDGGQGWPGLRLRKDVIGTEDGLAKYPYVREGRRIKAVFTVKEEHVGVENRILVAGKASAAKAAVFKDSVGVGSYHIDLHPTTRGQNYIDFDSLPFQIPLGALIPQRMENFLPANKNIGTTHITNGCYRLHPVEWNIGETVGSLAAFAISKKITPREVLEKPVRLQDFQSLIISQGIEIEWTG
ncbi:FAD-dependent oxidoreductase [Segetibacter koreensis]|uniref:FAD-dependent oxidoreductase n=1 Tax=Segetibacter koreensis TaxID=398037 RepID=UPI0003735DAE|nr:FAD-dependent oxidoreductase [Segetibacter koreensis]